MKITLVGDDTVRFSYLDTAANGEEVDQTVITADGTKEITSSQQDGGIIVSGANKFVIGEGEDIHSYEGLEEDKTYKVVEDKTSGDRGKITVTNMETGAVVMSKEEPKVTPSPKPTGIVTSKPQAVKVSKVTFSSLSKKIAAGKKVTIHATVWPENASNQKLTWKSSNKKVATVNSRGVVTFKKNSGGKTVRITASATDGSNASKTVKLTSMKGIVKKVAITGKKSVKAGKKLQLKAKVTATARANKKIKWISSNTKYATVNSRGKVTANKAGKGKTVKITAQATDGSGKKKTIKVKIK